VAVAEPVLVEADRLEPSAQLGQPASLHQERAAWVRVTPAEIRMYAQMGGSVVGMTGYPEVALAREAGIPYAGIAVVANMAAGMFDGEISHEEVSAALEAIKEPLFVQLGRAVRMV